MVEDGVGTFILMSDDPRAMEQFAQEVVPALREAVMHELPEAFSEPEIRRADVRVSTTIMCLPNFQTL